MSDRVTTDTRMWLVRRPPGPVMLARIVTTVHTVLQVPDHGGAAPIATDIRYRYELHHTCNGRGIHPRLSSEHEVTFDDDGLPTVEPSLDCPDCDLHGWIRNGEWTDA